MMYGTAIDIDKTMKRVKSIAFTFEKRSKVLTVVPMLRLNGQKYCQWR